jgi:purine-cytosine permease-like protein
VSFDWTFLPSIISAASGLGGVLLGGYLTWKREAARESDRIKKESSYLSILWLPTLIVS